MQECQLIRKSLTAADCQKLFYLETQTITVHPCVLTPINAMRTNQGKVRKSNS